MPISQHASTPARLRRFGGFGLAAAFVLTAFLAVPAPAQAVGPSGVTPETTTVRFDSTTGTDWAPPKGVRNISVSMAGGSGAEITREGIHTGSGRGGTLTFDLAVADGDRFRVFSATRGGTPHTNSAGAGYLNGGKGGSGSGGGTSGGGGGGAAAILRNDEVIAVAGGGGGAGGAVQGSITIPKPNPWTYGGAGGWGTSGEDLPGEKGKAGSHPGNGGSPGTTTGSSGTKGSDAATLTSSAGGGGGGGGWPSGNGGQSGKKAFSGSTGGGGAGGATFVTNDAANVFRGAQVDAHGYVEITYTNPVRVQLAAHNPFVAGVSQTLEVTVFGENGVVPRNGRVLLTEGNTFLSYDYVVDGRVDFRFALAEGSRTLTAEFTSLDRTQRARATLEVNVLPGPEHTVTSFRSVPIRAFMGGTFSLSGHVHSDNGIDPAGNIVDVIVDGVSHPVTIQSGGGFGGDFPVPNAHGPFPVKAVFAGGSAFEPSETDEISIEAFQYAPTAHLEVVADQLSFGESLSATVRVTGNYTPPTGTVQLLDGSTVLATAELDSSASATFDHISLPVGIREVGAVYFGNAHYGEVRSNTAGVTVAPAVTLTALTATSPTRLAGQPIEIGVDVTTAGGVPVEPQGTVEITHNGEIVASLSPGDDRDTTPRDGVARFETVIAEPAAGDHEFSARFVPTDSFAASNSDTATVTLAELATRITLRESQITAEQGATPVVYARISSGQEAGAQGSSRTSAPPLEGSVYATIGGELVSAPAPIDPATGEARIELPSLGLGRHAVVITFQSDTATFAPAYADLDLRVVPAGGSVPVDGNDSDSVDGNASDSVDGNASESLARTGSSAEPRLLVGSAGVLLLVGITIAASSRATRRKVAATPETSL